MSYSPTIIAASLDDAELRKSIDKLVNHVDDQLHYMVASTKVNVKSINDALKAIGDVDTKLGSKGSKDSGAAKQVKAQEELGEATRKTTSEIKRQGEIGEIAFDKMSKAQQVAIRSANPDSVRNADTLQTMRISLDLLIEKLREARSQYSAYVAMARNASTTGDKGYYQMATAGVHKYEEEVRNTIAQIRALRTAISQMGDVIAPQGHTIQNYVNSLGKINPELAKLNDQFKRGQSLLQQQGGDYGKATQSAQRYTDEIRRQAQAIRESERWKKTGDYGFIINEETGKLAWVTAKDRRSIEEQLVFLYGEESRAVSQVAQSENAAKDVARERLGTEQAITQEVEKRKRYISPNVSVNTSFNKMVANTLGLSESDINNTGKSIASLTRYTKQLELAWTKLSDAEKFSPFGKQLRQELQYTTRIVQQARAQLSRPINLKDALSGSEKTLDDIAYKIKRLQSYMSGLDTSNAKNAQEFQRAAMSADLLKEKQNALLQKNSQLIRSNGQLFASNTALGRSWTYMKNRLAFYFTVGASTQFVRELVDIRSQYEMNERALGILINSAERGTQIFNELSQMALVSPYTLIELSSAAKQLTAYDIAAKDVVDTTRRLADMASAVGVPMERLTYALGQIKAYGYLNSRDNRMFANAGIPLVKQLADYYTELEGKLVSTADVYDRIKKKAVSFEDTMGVIYKMTDEGGKFFDFQEKMAGTLKVQLANLTLAWNNMLNEIGSESQGLLTTGIGALKNFFLAWKDVEKILTDVVVIFGVIKAAQMLSTIAIGKQTIKTLEYVAANKLATASEYKRALSIRGINAEQARWLILANQSNKALISAIYQMGVLDGRSVAILKTLKGLRLGFAMFLLSGKMAINGLIAGFKSLGAAMVSNWPMVLLMAGIDLWQHMSAVSEKNAELNKGIADGAKEATKALGDFLSADDKVQMRLDAQNKKLTQAQGQKVWETIREQIELSAISAKQILPELIKIPDINDRITKSFEFAERIQKATEALSGLENELEAAQDSWLGGAFGEGLEEDIDDYVERIKKINNAKAFSDASTWEKLTFNTKEHLTTKLSEELTEAESEIRHFANDAADIIKERLGKEGIKDSIQVGEAVERIIKETEAKFPRIRGVGKKLFESITSDVMGEQFKGVYNSQEQYYKLFLEQLGKDYGSKFRDVTEEIKKDTYDWNSGQMDAIQRTAEKIKQDLPKASQDAIDNILTKLDTTEFKLRIVAQFATTTPNDVQKAFDERFYDMGTLGSEDARNKNIQKYQSFRLKEGENIVEYEKRISDEKKKQLEISQKSQEIISRGGNASVLKNATAEKQAADEWLKNLKEVEKWGGYDFSVDNKKTKSGGSSKKDLLGEAVQKNVQYINEIRKAYEDFKKDGLNATDAVEAATKHFGKSLARNNKELAKYGIQGLTGEQFATMNLQQVRDYFQNMINGAQGSAKAVEILEKEVKNIDAELIKFNQKTIADSLNNELSKLKDEYELAVALDADPEMGNLFAEMFGINTETLPKTIKEYADKMTEYLNKYLEGNKSDFRFGAGELFNLTQGDIDAFQSQVSAGTFNQAWFDVIKKAYDDINGKRQKELQDIFNKTKELEYKLADVNGKIAIEQKKLSDLQIKWQKETNEQKKHYLELQIQDQKNAIEQLEMESVKLMPFYEDLFGDLYNLSTRRLKEIIANAKQVMKPQNFVTDPSGQGYVQRTIAGKNGKNKVVYDIFSKDADGKIKKTTVSLDEYRKINKQIASVEKEVAEKNPWAKIKDSFSKDESGKIKNVAGGIEAIGGEISKMGQLTGVIGEIFASFSNPDEYNETAEVLGDISATMDGLGQAAQGVAQIYSGDIIGGATNVIKGLWTSISTWFDNTDKLIQQEIKDSEKAVKRLENSYKDLEFAVEHAYGMAEYGAKRAVIANKQLQLVEMQRQLRLEQSRESKYRDNDKILELKGSIIDLRNEIKQSIDDITNDLLGITSVGDAAEQLVSSMIDAFRQGEDYMTHFDESFEDMIDNMIMKAIVSRVIGDRLDEVWEQVKQTAEVRGEAEKKRVDALTKQLSDAQDKQMTAQAKYDNTVQEGLGQSVFEQIQGINTQKDLADANAEVKRVQALLKQAEKDYAEAIALKPEDVQGIRDILPSWRDDTENMFNSFMEAFGIKKGDRAEDKNLSNLQQGIVSITEDTANAVEAYLNGMSQQAYLRNDLLTQIRDTVQSFDLDVQTATQAQMLLQLQQSYAVQMAIQGILESVLTPNGRSFSVELAS